jgi:hypothetical protein
MKLCECGCGQPTKIAPQSHTRDGFVLGQPRRFIAGHHSRVRPAKDYPTALPSVLSRTRLVHRQRAERALGRVLPRTAVVHHADGSKRPDAQLVICDSPAYHQFLHTRMRIVARGGNPDTEKICKACQIVKPRTAFVSVRSRYDGLDFECRACKNERSRAAYARRQVSL